MVPYYTPSGGDVIWYAVSSRVLCFPDIDTRHDVASMKDQAWQMRAVEREGRRRRRRAKGVAVAGQQLGGGVSTRYEGLSSDDEQLETNRLKFTTDIGMHL